MDRTATWASGIARRVGSAPLVVLLVLCASMRIVADLLLPAGEVDLYEFGVIAENVVDGRGYSYFGVVGSSVLPHVAGPGTPIPSAFMPPGYTALVILATGIAHLVGGGPEVIVLGVRVLNLALALAVVGLLVALGRELHSRAAGVLAATGFSLYPTFVYQPTQISASNLYLLLEVAMLLVALRSRREPTMGRFVLLGAVLGLLCLTRAEAVLLIPLLALWLFVTMSQDARRRTGTALVATFAAVAVALPGAWIARSSVALEGLVPTVATTGGYNLYIGNGPEASGSQKGPGPPAAPYILERERLLAPGADYELRRDALYRDGAVSEIVTEPGSTVVRAGTKLAMLLTFDPYDERARSPFYIAGWALLVVSGICGATVWWRSAGPDRRPTAILIGGYTAFSIVIPMAFFVLARSKLPLELVLVVFTGVLVAAWTACRERHGSPDTPAAQRGTSAG